MRIEFMNLLINFNKIDLSCIAILFDFIDRIHFFLICIIRITIALYTNINTIITFINVFKNVFAHFDIRINFNIDISVVFDRQI